MRVEGDPWWLVVVGVRVCAHIIRGWLRGCGGRAFKGRSEVEDGDLQSGNARLRRQHRLLHRADEIVKATSTSIATELDRPGPQ